LGIPEDIAGVMVYLASPAGSYMQVTPGAIPFIKLTQSFRNGEDISVDGGARLCSGAHSKL
jgi:NAD(P)-dependent dehydrogenase (short-subunit alcohol dehydrogenase family)